VKASGPKVPVKVESKTVAKLATREFDDMFERDFDEVEFDARDFEDDLYLD